MITEQFAFGGEYIAPGAKFFNIADLSKVIVKAPFPDYVASALEVGAEATIQPQDLHGEELTGQVSLISPATDPASRTVEVWVKLDNSDHRLKDDGAATVRVVTSGSSNAVVAPAAAVTLDASNKDEGTVMVVDEQSIARETKIKAGIRTADTLEIVEGLSGGETLVVEGNYALPDGTRVEITAEDAEQNAQPEKE